MRRGLARHQPIRCHCCCHPAYRDGCPWCCRSGHLCCCHRHCRLGLPCSCYPQLLPLAEELALQYRDLHSGIHRLSFEQQRVHLTLAIGSAHEYLRSEDWQADSVYLDGFSPAKNPDIWSPTALRAVARCCIPGHTQLAT